MPCQDKSALMSVAPNLNPVLHNVANYRYFNACNRGKEKSSKLKRKKVFVAAILNRFAAIFLRYGEPCLLRFSYALFVVGCGIRLQDYKRKPRKPRTTHTVHAKQNSGRAT